MRVPLATPLGFRSNDFTKDSRIVNGYIETEGEKKYVTKRPGLVSLSLTPSLPTNLPLGLYFYYGSGNFFTVISGNLYRINNLGAVTTNIGPLAYSGTSPFSFTESDNWMFGHNANSGFGYSPVRGLFPILPGSGATFSITLSSGVITAVAVLTGGTGYGVNGGTIVGVGVPSPTGNGAVLTPNVVGGVITSVAVTAGGANYTAFDEAIAYDGCTNFPTNQGMVLTPGAVYLDDTIYVFTTEGRIYGSDIEDPFTWNALNYVSHSSESDGGVGIGRHLSYVVAFGNYSTEFFYDSANPTGSPLSKNDTVKMSIGCSNANTIVQIEQVESLVWVGSTRNTGKGVYCLNGLTPQKISTKAVEAFLNADSQMNPGGFVWANTTTIAGHTFYILSGSTYTFVYDFNEMSWYQWTSATYNIYGVLIEEPFQALFIEGDNSGNSLVMFSNGTAAYLNTNVYQDEGMSILYRVVTPKHDNNSNKIKFWYSLQVIGDQSSGGIVQVRHTNDDYQTWSTYKRVDMSLERPMLFQLGQGRRKAFEIYSVSNSPIRLEGMEIEVEEGEI